MVRLLLKVNQMQGKIGIKTLLLSIALLCTSISLFGQDDLRVFGNVKDTDTFKKLDGVLVQVEQDGKTFDSFTTSGNAKFDFEMPLGHNYKFIFSKAGFVSKNVEISTKNIPEEDKEGGFDAKIDMSLFTKIDGFDESILDSPIGIMGYDPAKNSIDWDLAYTEQIQQKIKAEKIRLENAANSEELDQKEFDELMIKGSDNVTKEKYDRAVQNYNDALNIFPDNKDAQDKLEEAERLLAEQNAAEENQKAYDRAMQMGESAMKSEDYTLARTKFEEAKSLMPSEQTPKDRLRELDELEKDANAQKRFDEFITAGDSDMGSEDFQSALDNYKSARDIFPADKDVKKKIDEAQAKLDELLASENAEAAKEAQYKSFIDKAGDAFDSEKYERAIDYYNQALEVKPGEKYPEERIKEAEQRLKDLEKQQADATAAAESNKEDEEFNALVDQADDLFTNEKLDESRLKYSEALTIKPDEKYPRQRIQRIDDILAENERLAEEEAKRKEQEILENEKLAELNEEAEKQKAIEEERQRALEEERRELERLAQEEAQKKLDSEKRRRTLTSNIDPNKERQAEEYYAQEKERIDKKAQTDIEKIKRDHYQTIYDKNEQFKFEARSAADDIERVKEEKSDLAARGQNFQKDKNNSFERKEKDIQKTNQELAAEADNRRKDELYEVEELKERQQKTIDKRSEFEENVNDVKQKKAEIAQAQKGYIQNGNVLRKDNQYNLEDTKKDLKEMAEDGEEQRQESQENLEKTKEKISKQAKENVSLQNDRIDQALNSTDRLKLTQKESAQLNDELRSGNVQEVEYQKETRQELLENKASQAEIQRSIARDKAFDVDRGQAKDFDDYRVVPGTEELAEGVTERSYEINNGNKLVIERTLKIGNKIVTYSKVIAKHGIYYFRDGKSITKTTWERDTLRLAD